MVKICLLVIGFTYSALVSALGDRLDMDLDNDGLIEINDHIDLNDIRNHLSGSALHDSSVGCPVNGCVGFELTGDIDLDTNADGVINSIDLHWNGGAGWSPIGSKHGTAFSAIFNGNGYRVQNLFISSNAINIGFFGYLEGATISNLGVLANKTSVSGFAQVGIFAGEIRNSVISNSYSQGRVIGTDYVGGFIGVATNSEITNSYSSVDINASNNAAGFIVSVENTQIEKSYSTGFLDTEGTSAALHIYRLDSNSQLKNSFSSITYTSQIQNTQLVSYGSINVVNSYWSDSIDSPSDSIDRSYLGVDLSILKCVDQPNGVASNLSCETGDHRTVFKGWSQSVWDFGDHEQLPGIILNGAVHRDSDGDGKIDEIDDFPLDWRVFKDSDNDGHPDGWNTHCDDECALASGFTLDQFPNSRAAFLDLDFDGLPDSWSLNCDVQCQLNSGLILDVFLDDEDNDGILNITDHDDDGDGSIDADLDGNGLIEIGSIYQLYQVNFNLEGVGRTLNLGGDIDVSGCPWSLSGGQYVQMCDGYELIQNIDFDTNMDGSIDAEDSFWNDGSGWEPIGFNNDGFKARFIGNGFSIMNLFINRPFDENVGLFSFVQSSEIKELAVFGKNTYVSGYRKVGLLAGALVGSVKIDGVFLSGKVIGDNDVGAVVGRSGSWQTISNIFSSVKVEGRFNTGGIVGQSDNTGINNSLVVGSIESSISHDAISGAASNPVIVDAMRFSNVYWSNNTATNEQPNSYYTNENVGGFELVLLQHTAKDFTVYSEYQEKDIQIYYQWPDDPLASIHWSFLTAGQLPSLVLNGTEYKDSDGDGLIDDSDLMPFDYDNDGVNDENDKFPAVSIGDLVDDDNDGAPRECNQECLLLGLEQDDDDAIPYVNPIFESMPVIDEEEVMSLEDNNTAQSPGGGSIGNLLLVIIIFTFRFRREYLYI